MKTHIVFSLTYNIAFTVVTAMNSIVDNSAAPQQLQFHIAVPEGEQLLFESYFQAHCKSYCQQIQVREFVPPAALRRYVEKFYTDQDASRYAARYMNYARFYFHHLFKDVGTIIYLDTDLVVIKDIHELRQNLVFTPEQFYAAVPHLYWAPMYFKNPLKYWREVKKIKTPFNGGVFATDLQYWDSIVDTKLQYYFDLNLQAGKKIWTLSTEPLQNLLFPDYLRLERKWNRCGYGNVKWMAQLLQVSLEKAAVIHWSGGVTKPWTHPDIPYSELWHRYQPKLNCEPLEAVDNP